MLNLPKSTEFHQRIPKQKFYESLVVTPAQKKAFTEQIKVIYWRNKLAATTLNIVSGERVTEVEIFEIKLNVPDLDENVLRLIDRAIPYHILFLLEYEGRYRAAMAYKEVSKGKDGIQVDRYFHTSWLPEDMLQLHLDGLTMDDVYENFIRQIAGKTLPSSEKNTLKESLELQRQRELLDKQIATLETKMRKEKQLNRKMELKGEIKKLKANLEGLM